MYYYRLYGFRVISDIEFPQLVPEPERAPDAFEIHICNGKIPEYVLETTDKAYEFGESVSWLTNRTTWLFVENGERITYSLKAGGNETYLRTYILGWGISMLALQRGILAIHCSALSDERGAVLIAGESGAGKSTLTTAFLEKGYQLMADDMALVEVGKDGQVWAKPAFPFQKLCRNVALEKGYELDKMIFIDEEKDKFLVPYEGKFGLEPVKIKAFILLGIAGGDEVMAQELTGIDKFYVYANNLFLRHLLKQDKYKPEIGQKCLEMAARVPTYYIGRPNGRDTVDAVLQQAFEFLNT